MFISVKDDDKLLVAPVAAMPRLGFDILATKGTHASLEAQGIMGDKATARATQPGK